MFRKLLIVGLFFLVGCNKNPLNNPYPKNEEYANTRYTSFSSLPKTLDPAKSYTVDENVFVAQIYEPPLQYHYLKRPFTLIPLTAVSLPKISYLDTQGKALSPTLDQNVAYSVYEITIQPGIYYQPHPAFARDQNGRYLYHHLPKDYAVHLDKLSDFKQVGTRELTAEDYVYEIKRLASPRINSPIYGFMEKYIVGLGDFAKQLAQEIKHNSGFLDLRRYPLAGATVVDRYTYRIILKGKYPQFNFWLAMPFFAPIPWEADLFYSQAGMSDNNISFDWYPVGTGPYRLTENNPNRRMVLAKNPYFHPEYYPTEGEPGDAAAGYLANAGKRLPFIDKVIFSLEKEYMPRWNKFLQGYYDVATISSDSFDQAFQADLHGRLILTKELRQKGIRLQSSISPSLFYLGFNMLDPVVGGYTQRAKNLRKAIAIVIDYEEYINIFMNGRGMVAQSPIPPGIFGYRAGKSGIDPNIFAWIDDEPKRKSIHEAQKLMQQAGFRNGIDKRTGRPLVLNYDVSFSGAPEEKALLEWLRKQFAKLGIQLNIRGTEYNRFQERMRLGQAQLFSWGWSADYPDPENFLFLLYGPNGKAHHGGENAGNYANAEYDKLFEIMRNLPNGEERQKIIDRMLAILYEDEPWVWGMIPKDFLLTQSWNYPSKPNNIINNTLKYQRLNPKLRAQLRDQWNIPVYWPLGVMLIALVLLAVPVILRYLHKERVETVKPRKRDKD